MKTKRVLSLVLAVLLCVGLLPLSVFATGKTYLALGDSISTGYGLKDDKNEAFPNLLVDEESDSSIKGYTLDNKAVNGQTTSALLYAIQNDATYKTSIANADVITLTIGGNDMMAYLYSFLADSLDNTLNAEQKTALLAKYSETTWGVSVIKKALEAQDSAVLALVAPFVGEFKMTEAQVNTITSNFASIITGIRASNSDATLIVTTQYNPYEKLATKIETTITQATQMGLTIPNDVKAVADAITALSDNVDTQLASFGVAIQASATTTGLFKVADVYTAFKNDKTNLSNADFTIKEYLPKLVYSINLDFHPNAAGHAKIAETIEPLLPAEPVAPTTYTITVATSTNGTASATPTTAEAGVTITLTATPADGYKFKEWAVVDAENNAIAVTKNTFTMPASNVTVTATFEAEAPAPHSHNPSFSFVAEKYDTLYISCTDDCPLLQQSPLSAVPILKLSYDATAKEAVLTNYANQYGDSILTTYMAMFTATAQEKLYYKLGTEDEDLTGSTTAPVEPGKYGVQLIVGSDLFGYYTLYTEFEIAEEAPAVHQHNFRYTVAETKDALLINCNNTSCPVDFPQTLLTISAPANTVYDGTAKEAKLALNTDALALIPGVTPEMMATPLPIYYMEEDATADTGWKNLPENEKPVEAGKYIAYARFETQSISIFVEYTITEKEPDPKPESKPDKTWSSSTNKFYYDLFLYGSLLNDTKKPEKVDAVVEVKPEVEVEPVVPTLPFTDVAVSDTYYDDVLYVYLQNLMNGVSDTSFDPQGSLTRGMLVTILHRLEGAPAINHSGTFDDVADGQWYTDGVEWATANGIVTGYGNGSFGPSDSLTREQLVTIIWRYANYLHIDTSIGENTNILSYTDAFDVSEYAIPAMQWACGAGLLNIRDNATLAPVANALRFETATVLHRFHANLVEAE